MSLYVVAPMSHGLVIPFLTFRIWFTVLGISRCPFSGFGGVLCSPVIWYMTDSACYRTRTESLIG